MKPIIRLSGKGMLLGAVVAGATLFVFAAATAFLITQPIVFYPRLEAPRVDPIRLEKHTRKLSQEFLPRNWTHIDNLDRTAVYIRGEFVKAGGATREQVYEMEGRRYRNVIARFGPRSKDPVIVGAHYDAFDELPGADDNASGVAGLIELAHMLSHQSLETQVELVAFTLEEPKTPDGDGLFRTEYGGSAQHVRSLQASGVRPRIFIDLEMIGYFTDEPHSQNFPSSLIGWLYPSRGNFVAIVGKITKVKSMRRLKAAMLSASPLPVRSMSAHEIVEGVDWSDHANYWKAGFDAVMITDTALNRNHKYHTAGDTADRLDYKRMAMVVQGVYNAILDFAR